MRARAEKTVKMKPESEQAEIMTQTESSILYDTAVVGAGAAGLTAAIHSRRLGLKTILLDGREKIGAKILMSGGTRCNVTNQKVSEQDFQSERRRSVRNVLRAYPAERTEDFFRALGVELVLEPGGKLFPSTHSGRTILEALTREADFRGVRLVTGCKVDSIRRKEPFFELGGTGFSIQSRTVILCTGGLSFPTTGSDGSGYALAQAMGHSLVETSPSLTPLLTADEAWKKLSGLTLPVRISLVHEALKIAEYEGSFLFTHTGFSGPAVLNISRHWIRLKDPGAVLTIQFLPGIKEEAFRAEMGASLCAHPKMKVKNFLAARLPEKLAQTLLDKAEIPAERILNQLSKTEREALIRVLFRCGLSVSGSAGYAKAEVTAGGVRLDEVEESVMESKLQPGLFFAGEILDADGRIGGFNFQWAWSSGEAAARGARRRVDLLGKES